MARAAQKTKSVVVPITMQESHLAIKNSIRIALSAVCYLRNLFPDDLFKPKLYCGVELMIFDPAIRKNPELNPNAFNLVETFEKGVFNALEKRYIDRLLFNVHSDDPLRNKDAPVLESYSFKFESNAGKLGSKDSSNMKMNGEVVGKTKPEVQNSTRSLLKRLVMLTTALSDLPSKTWLSVNIIYNDSCPKDYEPPLFEHISQKDLPDFKNVPLAIKIGATDTGLETVTLKLRKPESEQHEPEFEKLVQIEESQSQQEFKAPNATFIERKLEKMDLQEKSKDNWTQDTFGGEKENRAPYGKASRARRKILCGDSDQEIKRVKTGIDKSDFVQVPVSMRQSQSQSQSPVRAVSASYIF